jgi:signal recognition particle GTPase
MFDIKEQLIKADIALIQLDTLIEALNKDIVLLEEVISSQDKIIKMQRNMLDKTEAFVTKMRVITSGKEERTNDR